MTPHKLGAFVAWQFILFADCKTCIKRTEIGTRIGNVYECNDPKYPECCEQENTFLCCEPDWKRILINQVWLIITLVSIFGTFVMACVCFKRQGNVFEADTASEAFLGLRRRLLTAFGSLTPTNKEDPRCDQDSNSFLKTEVSDSPEHGHAFKIV